MTTTTTTTTNDERRVTEIPAGAAASAAAVRIYYVSLGGALRAPLDVRDKVHTAAAEAAAPAAAPAAALAEAPAADPWIHGSIFFMMNHMAAAHLFCQSAFHTVSRFFASTRLGRRTSTYVDVRRRTSTYVHGLGGWSRSNHFKKFAPEGQIF